MSEPIDYLEKYRLGYEFVLSQYEQKERAQQFGRWFAESDWDDPQVAWLKYPG